VENRFAPYAPIQMFVGDKDAWNPAAPCQALARRQEAGKLRRHQAGLTTAWP